MTEKKIKILNRGLDFIFALLIVLSCYLASPVVSSRVLYLPKGGVFDIIAHLEKGNFEISRIDALFIRLLGYPQSGWIDMGSPVLSRGDFFYRLTKAKAAIQQVTLIPGETFYFFARTLANDFSLDVGAIEEAYNKYAPYSDGVIFADTYNIPLGISAENLMQHLIASSLERHRALSIKILGQYDEAQWFKYVTIASIIQKEAANAHEMPLVSAVIYNRLRKKMALQMDGSLNYGKYSHTAVTSARIRNDSTPYNTYRFKGIPPNPIGSVSFDAIKAAISPADVDYLFFVKNPQGTHTFSKDYQEHLKNIR